MPRRHIAVIHQFAGLFPCLYTIPWFTLDTCLKQRASIHYRFGMAHEMRSETPSYASANVRQGFVQADRTPSQTDI